jgi:tetratricopeptide (TPR) repeat protein
MIRRLNTTAATAAMLLVLAAGPLAAQEPTENKLETGLPAGLADFLRARLLESRDSYREALAAYDRALGQDPTLVEVRVGYANLLFELGMAGRAVELLESVDGLDWYGRRVLALALAQVSVQDPGRMEEAEKALRDVLGERDDDPNLLLALGQLYHRMNRIEEAEAAIAALQENRPGSPQLVAYHAALLRQLGRKEEAALLYAGCASGGVTAASCRDNAVDLLVELDRPAEAADLMLAWLEDDDLDQLMRAGFLLWEGGRPVQALQVVERVLRQVPDSEKARTLKAHLLSATGRYPEAVQLLKALLKANPTDLDLELSMAWAVAQTGDHAEARRWIDRAWEHVSQDAASQPAVRCAVTGARIELSAGNPLLAREWLGRIADPREAGDDYVRLLGESYRRQEDWAAGISAMVRIQPRVTGDARLTAEAVEAEFRLRSSDHRAWQRLRPLLDSGRLDEVLMGLQVLQAVERWADSEHEAAAALARFPGDRNLLFTRAASLERLGRFDEAENVFLTLIEVDPTDPAAANYLGYLWAERDTRLDEALELVNRAVAADPENPAYLDSLGWVHFRRGAMEEAEFWLRRAIELDDGDGTLRAHLGEVLLARGETQEGSENLRLALDLGCEQPERVRSLLASIGNDPPR